MINIVVGYVPSVTGSSMVSSGITVNPPKPYRGDHHFQLLLGDLQTQKSISSENICCTSSIDQHSLNIKIYYVVYYH